MGNVVEYLEHHYRSILSLDVLFSNPLFVLTFQKIVELYELSYSKYVLGGSDAHGTRQLEILMGACLAELNHFHSQKTIHLKSLVKHVMDASIKKQETVLAHLITIKQALVTA